MTLPEAGWSAEDLDRTPGLPPRAEIIDGSLVTPGPQQLLHMKALRLLENALARLAPWDQYRARREMSVVLGPRQRLEPDVMLVHAAAEIGPGGTWYPADAVILVVEVVSPDSEERDRKRKPQLYADAGIEWFWRVEDVDGKIVLYAYELDPAIRQYSPLGIFHDRVTLTVPFAIDIDLTEIDRF
ncbi:Uma2 family endonuclease [Actinoplanes sp. HUAS TT8]|uniref:Uma2 family endonuclease n=1 Tax=Actinoplanes sp. HUAS TT8 TaxID=3447453 RepID=UPI003F51E41F